MKSFLLFFVAFLAFLPIIHTQTVGELTVSVSTSDAGGNYQPRNIIAIWIEDEQGNFIKTLLAYANNRKTHLNTWQATTADAGSEFNTVDAITGPTRNSHSTRTCMWDGSDFNGLSVDDGTYSVWMELTDKNSTGNFSSFSFVKSEEPQNITPFNEPSFSSIVITWDPEDPTAINEPDDIQKLMAYPNPGNGKYFISGSNNHDLEVWSGTGNLIMTTRNTTIDISNQPDGVYYLVVNSDSGRKFFRVIKN